MKIGIWIMRAVEIAFFAGLIGCAVVVITSWISIVREGFSKDKPSDR